MVGLFAELVTGHVEEVAVIIIIIYYYYYYYYLSLLSITLNENSTRLYSEPSAKVLRRPRLPQNGDQNASICRLLDDFDNKGRKVCCKVLLYKNCQRQSCSAINFLSSGINILAGDDPFPLKSCLQVTCPLRSMVSYGRCQNS